MSTDLVERLREEFIIIGPFGSGDLRALEDRKQAADLIEALQSDVERLTAERDEAVIARGRLQDSNSDMAHKWTAILRRADAAEASLAAERQRVAELGTAFPKKGLPQEIVETWAQGLGFAEEYSTVRLLAEEVEFYRLIRRSALAVKQES